MYLGAQLPLYNYESRLAYVEQYLDQIYLGVFDLYLQGGLTIFFFLLVINFLKYKGTDEGNGGGN
jgi:hypothetical protein